MTLKDRLIQALEAQKATVVQTTSTKYVVYRLPSSSTLVIDPANRNVYVGKKGAVRVGRTVTDSIPNDRLMQRLLESLPVETVKATVTTSG